MELVIFLAILILFAICAFWTTGPVDKQVLTCCRDCLYFAEGCCVNELSDHYGFKGYPDDWCELSIKRPEDPA